MPRVPSSAAQTERDLRARLLDGVDHYDELVQKAIASAKVSLWISTANVKEMRVEAPIGTVARAHGRFVSILDTLSALRCRASSSVSCMLASRPGPFGPSSRSNHGYATVGSRCASALACT
jgi:hypothetical protein